MKKIIKIALIFSAFAFVSCASTPEKAKPDQSEEQENSEKGADEEVSGQLESNEGETSEESSLTEELLPEEKITEEELPEIPLIEIPADEEISPEMQPVPEITVKDDENIEDNKIVNPPEEKVSDKETSSPIQKDETSEKNDVSTEKGPAENTVPESLLNEIAPENTDVSGSSAEETESSEDENTFQEKPVPSRSMTVQKNQQIDIVYPGKGWIYQGCIDEDGNVDVRNKNFIFGGKKLGGKNQSFTLRSRNAGTYLLHFYKNDNLTGNYIDDYLEVNVEDKTIDTQNHVTAPDYASFVPPEAKITSESLKAKKAAENSLKTASQNGLSEEAKSSSAVTKNAPLNKAGNVQAKAAQEDDSSGKTVIQTTESKPDLSSKDEKKNLKAAGTAGEKKSSGAQNKNTENSGVIEIEENDSTSSLSSDMLLEKARKLYDSGNYREALDTLDQFFDKAADRVDEGLFLQGQVLEAKSEVQNIKNAIDSYDLIVKNYPASTLWEKAGKRSMYLKRFYINIR